MSRIKRGRGWGVGWVGLSSLSQDNGGSGHVGVSGVSPQLVCARVKDSNQKQRAVSPLMQGHFIIYLFI